MSRLDDDLKAAFKRQEPSPDFTARLMARINEAPAPQPRLTLWQRLAGVFALPALRWATVGAMALLLIIIGITQLRSHRTSPVNGAPQLAGTPESHDTHSKTASEQPGTNSTIDTPQTLAKAPTVPTPSAQPDGRPHLIRHHVREAREARVEARQAQPSAEAEAAKEKILFALQITNSTLSEVQRAIADDTREDHPEPVQNR